MSSHQNIGIPNPYGYGAVTRDATKLYWRGKTRTMRDDSYEKKLSFLAVSAMCAIAIAWILGSEASRILNNYSEPYSSPIIPPGSEFGH